VVYYHGGGWVLGDEVSDDPLCRDLCRRSDLIILSVGYRFDGLAKSALSGQGLTMAVPSSGNDELPREDALSDALPERSAKHDLLEDEAKQVSQAAIDQTKSPASKRGGLVLLGPVVAALLFLAAASGWFVLAGKGAKTTEPARLSIVIMPFANLSGDPAQDYLVDALTDELTTSLARIRDTFVIARSTAMTLKGKPIDAKMIGKDLGVRYVLEGSVQPSGDRMRVNASSSTPAGALTSGPNNSTRPAPICCRRKTRSSRIWRAQWTFN
jgi:alpha/beta hydrolase fold